MDTIFIDHLETSGILGIHPHEQREPQPIRISARIGVDISKAAEDDDINKSVNYSTLAKKIIEIIDQSHFYTVEALSQAIANEILTDERIQRLWLRIEKPNAVSKAESVGIEINR